MSLMIKRVVVIGSKGREEIEVSFDSMSRHSVVRKDFAEKIANLISLVYPKRFILADGKTEITSNEVTILEIIVDGKELAGSFYVVDKLSRNVIIGADFMQAWSITLDLKNEKISVESDPKAIELF